MKRYVIIIFSTVFLASCGVAVDYDYEKSTDFSNYKTYNYFTDMSSGLSELDEKRLIRTLDAQLRTMGLQKSDTPDFRIDLKSQEFTGPNRSTVGVGLGGGGRNVGGGISVGIPVGRQSATRELSIEFVDDSKNGMFWQVVSESQFNNRATPDQREAYFSKVVEKMMSKYPPKTK
ncbi:DUF4136 domain-containing protein [Winogradskyella maritima]|uniref:DUF4136 domain-containing protein n=1 Tax=Winogradskyella maritima TaxID=1517766 RepID=A0ABV8AL83_9FLAO|nr:DUF4136 domain-containing protein [Winogradskyella maritima]